jgi:hypothetical protein
VGSPRVGVNAVSGTKPGPSSAWDTELSRFLPFVPSAMEEPWGPTKLVIYCLQWEAAYERNHIIISKDVNIIKLRR